MKSQSRTHGYSEEMTTQNASVTWFVKSHLYAGSTYDV
jgi:hypothetical protein